VKLKEARRIVQARGQVGPDRVPVDEAINAGMAWADEILSCAGTGIGAFPAKADIEQGRDVYPSGGFDRIILVERQSAYDVWDAMNYGTFTMSSQTPPGYWWTHVGAGSIRISPNPSMSLEGGLRIWGYPSHQIDPKGDQDSSVVFPPYSRNAVLWYAALEAATLPAAASRAEKALGRAELTFRKHVEIPQAGVPSGLLKERP
jgi:hypothetical protein